MTLRHPSEAPLSSLLSLLIITASCAAGTGRVAFTVRRRTQADDGASYDALAARVVPAQLSAALNCLDQLGPKTGPDDVKPLRKALLSARDALDIFSFAYPTGANGSATGPATQAAQRQGGHTDSEGEAVDKKPLDVWFKLRKGLDEGYQLIGDFQDLAHSGVAYNESDVQAARAICLHWLHRFIHDCRRYHFDRFVSNPLQDGYVQHGHMSKFYWGYEGCTPDESLTGRQNLARLLHSQLQNVMDNYTVVRAFKHVYVEPDHTRFHFFRKLARSILAVLTFSPNLIPSSTPNTNTLTHSQDSHHITQPQAFGVQGSILNTFASSTERSTERRSSSIGSSSSSSSVGAVESTSWLAAMISHIASLSTSLQNHLTQWHGSSRRLLFNSLDRANTETQAAHGVGNLGDKGKAQADTSLAYAGRTSGLHTSGSVSRAVGPLSVECDTSGFVDTLGDLFRSLGKVNDQVFAYEFYLERGMSAEAETARVECDYQWGGVQLWMDTVHLDWQVRCAMDALDMGGK